MERTPDTLNGDGNARILSEYAHMRKELSGPCPAVAMVSEMRNSTDIGHPICSQRRLIEMH
jgi:hypothetical protein